jgi:hypothetical protein
MTPHKLSSIDCSLSMLYIFSSLMTMRQIEQFYSDSLLYVRQFTCINEIGINLVKMLTVYVKVLHISINELFLQQLL